MLQNELQKFDLEEKEASIYLALLELGEASIGEISKKSAVKRTTVYHVLEALKQRGLAKEIKKGKKVRFFAEDPRALLDTLEEKKEKMQKLLPQLLALTNLIDNKPKIRFYEGVAGIKEVYKDTLRHPDCELLAWVSEEAVQAFDEPFLNEYYLPKRLEKKIWVRAIAPATPYMEQYGGLDRLSLRRTKLLSAEQFPLTVEINLYGRRKIAIMSFGEKVSMIIESEKIFITLRSIFESQWAMLPERKQKQA